MKSLIIINNNNKSLIKINLPKFTPNRRLNENKCEIYSVTELRLKVSLVVDTHQSSGRVQAGLAEVHIVSGHRGGGQR